MIRDPTFTPAMFTARVITPVALTSETAPLHLDGLVEFAAARDAGLPSEAEAPPIPIAQHPDGFYLASCAMFAGMLREGVFTATRGLARRDLLTSWPKTEAMSVHRGPHKILQTRYHLFIPQWVVWFAVCDPEETLRLLKEWVPAIGSARARGFGTVAEWSMEPQALHPDDRPTFPWMVAGTILRTVPVETTDPVKSMIRNISHSVHRAPWRPPYHRRREQPKRLCAVPHVMSFREIAR
jgi:hypothetical protein